MRETANTLAKTPEAVDAGAMMMVK